MNNEKITPQIGAVPSDNSASWTHWRSGLPDQAPFILLGSEFAWSPFQESLSTQLDASIPMIRISLSAVSHCRTVHGAAACLVHLIQSLSCVVSPLRILAHASAARVVHTLATQYLMLDLPVGLVGVLDPALNVGPCSDDDWLESISKVSNREEYLGQHFELHWFSLADNPTCTFAHQRMRAWTLNSAEPSALAQSVADAIIFTQANPTLVQQDDPLVAIQLSRSPSAPYLCFPGAGANVVDFFPLSMAMGDSIPFFGFQPRGLYSDQLPSASVEAAAQRYMEIIRVKFPFGPLHLVGHSFGGWVAFEVALRLQAQGRVVGSLTLMDSEVPGLSQRIGREYTRPEALMLLVENLEQAADRSMDLSQQDIERSSCEQQLALLHQKMVAVGLLRRTSQVGQISGMVRSFESAVRTRYGPSGPFQGVTRLVLACKKNQTPAQALTHQTKTIEGWRTLAPQLQHKVVAGNHMTLLKPPCIEQVVCWLASFDAPATI